MRFCSLRVQTPPKKVFWGGFGGLNPFSGGTWTLRGWLKHSKHLLEVFYHFSPEILFKNLQT